MLKKHLFVSLLLCMHCFDTIAQLTETFSDLNFTDNPKWFAANPNDWIVNSNGILQSQSTLSNNSFWISTKNELAVASEWLFDIRMEFNPSSANYADLYLIASDSNLHSAFTAGYFVRIGNTEDEISLYRKDAGGKLNKLIDGRNGLLNKSSNSLQIRVLRDNSSNWYLFSKTDNNGFIEEGRAVDSTYLSSRYFGCLIAQSSSGFFQKHFLDNMKILSFVPDGLPPKLQTGYTLTDSSLELIFDEPLHPFSNKNKNRFQLGADKLSPVAINITDNKINLVFQTTFIPSEPFMLYVHEIEDLWGNRSVEDSMRITYHPAQAYELLITEIMADPTPSMGLPESEWIEIKNTGSRMIPLKGWQLQDASGPSVFFQDRLLFPDSSLIVCPESNESLFQLYGNVMGLTAFPSLNNDRDTLHLINEEGKTMHVVSYEKSWFRNPVKAEGGWSLEMIDDQNPCGGKDNWTASPNNMGGTPGKSNGAMANNKDLLKPRLLRAFATDPSTLMLSFDESLQTASAANPAHYELEGENMIILEAVPLAPHYNRVLIKLETALETEKIYTLRVKKISDCSGNEIGTFNAAQVALAQAVDKGDLIIHEILFNPKADGVDYVEIFNRSNKPINLKHIFLANKNVNGVPDQIRPLVNEDRLIFPGGYLLITADTEIIERQFVRKNTAVFVTCNPLPSFPDEKGSVVLLNREGTLLDELNYQQDWHFPLLTNREGVALERIHPDDSTQKKENWISAASDAGFGTPGIQNSQYLSKPAFGGTITAEPPIFTPDNSGSNNYLLIRYRFENSGFVLNTIVYDAEGKAVCRLAKNHLCGVEGTLRWDGLDDLKRPLATGPYLIWTEIFHPLGKVKRFINRAVLVRK